MSLTDSHYLKRYLFFFGRRTAKYTPGSTEPSQEMVLKFSEPTEGFFLKGGEILLLSLMYPVFGKLFYSFRSIFQVRTLVLHGCSTRKSYL